MVDEKLVKDEASGDKVHIGDLKMARVDSFMSFDEGEKEAEGSPVKVRKIVSYDDRDENSTIQGKVKIKESLMSFDEGEPNPDGLSKYQMMSFDDDVTEGKRSHDESIKLKSVQMMSFDDGEK